MARNITKRYLDEEVSTANLVSIKINYEADDTVSGGYIMLECRDEQGNVVKSEAVHFTAAQFGAWNGTPAQALTYAINNSTMLNS